MTTTSRDAASLERELVAARETVRLLRLDAEALRTARTVDREHLVVMRNALQDIADGCDNPATRAVDALYAATPNAARIALNIQPPHAGDEFGGLRFG